MHLVSTSTSRVVVLRTSTRSSTASVLFRKARARSITSPVPRSARTLMLTCLRECHSILLTRIGCTQRSRIRVLNAVAFDAIYIQFYNNACGLPEYSDPKAWDFGSWDTWAKTVAPNKDVKVYIGALASSTAGGSGYVDATTLINIALETRSKYSSFGGVMLWDASQAYGTRPLDAFAEDCPLITSALAR